MGGKNVAIAGGMVLVVVVGFVLAKLLPSGEGGSAPEARSDGPAEAARREAERVAEGPGISQASEGVGTSRAAEGGKASTTQQQKAQELGRQILEALDALESCARRWEEQVVPLLRNRRGTLLASEPTLVNRFAELYVRVDPEQIGRTIASMRGTVREFSALLDAVNEASYAPSEEFLAGMEQTKETVDKLLATCRETHGEIADLLSTAEGRIPAETETTLGEALAQQASGESR